MLLKLSLAAVTALQLLVGLFVQLAILRAIGAGSHTDAYVAAQAVPLALLAIFSSALQAVWQPRLAIAGPVVQDWRVQQGLAQGQTLILFVAAASPLWAFRSVWIPGIFPGLGTDQLELVSALLTPLFLAAILNGHATLLITALRCREQFLRGEVLQLATSGLALLVVIVLVPQFGIKAAAWVLFARAALNFAVLFQISERPRLNIRQAVRAVDMWRQLRPLIPGTALHKTAPLVDRFWTSQGPSGSLTVFNLAQMLIGAAATTLERVIVMPATPALSRLVAKNAFSNVRQIYRGCVLRITLITGLFALALWTTQPWWGSIIGPALNIPLGLAEQMWLVCMFLVGYLHAAAAGVIAINGLYAMGDTRTPSLIISGGFFIGVAAKSIGYLMFGLAGLAAAASAYHLLNVALLCLALERALKIKGAQTRFSLDTEVVSSK